MRIQSSKIRDTAAVLPALFLLLAFFLAPVTGLLARSFLEPVPGFQNYIKFLTDTAYLNIVFNTFMVAGIVSAVTVVVGFPVAWSLAILPKRIAGRFIPTRVGNTPIGNH